MSHALPPLPAQPAGVLWPQRDWPTGPLARGVDGARLAALLDETFCDAAKDRIGQTHALLAVQGGRLVAERYADGFGPDSTCWSWSMAKSVTQALVGIAVGDGRLDIHAPADVPEWRSG